MADNDKHRGVKSAKKPLPAKGGVGVGDSALDGVQASQTDGLTHPPAPSLGREGEPERKCVLTGEKASRDELIRLALGPDGTVAPDVRARAPGRGAWIGVTRDVLEAAIAKGKLKGALARAFKTAKVIIPEDLPQQIEAALQRATLDRLGLEARAGTLLTGSEKIADAARKGAVSLLIHAKDAAADGSRKLDQALRVGLDMEGSDVRGLAIPASRAILSMALGRENVVHIALIAPAAAARVSDALGRWRGFMGRNDGPEPCETVSQGPTAHRVEE